MFHRDVSSSGVKVSFVHFDEPDVRWGCERLEHRLVAFAKNL